MTAVVKCCPSAATQGQIEIPLITLHGGTKTFFVDMGVITFGLLSFLPIEGDSS
jgi:hypothetical protein